MFHYKNNHLWVEDQSVAEIAQKVGTPCYLYSYTHLVQNWHAFNDALGDHPHKICYAVKANGNLAVLKALAQCGSGFDIVSEGELARVLAAGGLAQNVVFSGVGKTTSEIKTALKNNIFCFNIESENELDNLNRLAKELNVKANIAIRVNPDVDPQSHPYISTGLKDSKFGVDIKEAFTLYLKAKQSAYLNIQGIAFHIGSQLTSLTPFLDAFARVLKLVSELKSHGIFISHVDVGGGLGVRYCDEDPPTPSEYATAILDMCPKDLMLVLEPGRAIASKAGMIITQVLSIKKSGDKHYCIVDCAMNDFMRPTLYQAWQSIIPLKETSSEPAVIYDVVGPVCESGDFLGKDRTLSVAIGDYIAICDAGAYGFVMSSNYNARPRPCEVMVKDATFKVVRPRETIAQLYAEEIQWP